MPYHDDGHVALRTTKLAEVLAQNPTSYRESKAIIGSILEVGPAIRISTKFINGSF